MNISCVAAQIKALPRGSQNHPTTYTSLIDFSPCHYSLLSMNLVDYMHRANPETPIEETMRALAELKK